MSFPVSLNGLSCPGGWKDLQRLESVAPPVQAKLARAAMAPPPTARLLTRALSELKRVGAAVAGPGAGDGE